MHIVNVLSSPLGIVTQKTTDSLTITISGIVAREGESLVPGKLYYADHLGLLNEGEFAGLSNTEAYYVIKETEKKIMSDANRVGVALDSRTLYLNTHN